MIPKSLIEALHDWCVECDDHFTTEIGDWMPEPQPSCVEQGHHRALDPKRDVIWKICGRCRGEGTLRGFPGVYTSDDFAEDPDMFEDYMEHVRPCEFCSGSGKFRDFTDEAYERPVVLEWLDEHYRTEAIYRQERQMGA